jgi:hypothetical protein
VVVVVVEQQVPLALLIQMAAMAVYTVAVAADQEVVAVTELAVQ